MELGNHIKELRSKMSMSQEVLAEKAYVSRQTISSWENDKSYPDVKSLMILSEIFEVSIDELVKGDIEKMKEIIRKEDQKKLQNYGYILFGLMLILVVSAIPLIKYLGLIGACIWGVLFIGTMIFSFKVEKFKKENSISTYREITEYMKGNRLNEIETAREDGKKIYQQVLSGVIAGLITLAILLIIAYFLR